MSYFGSAKKNPLAGVGGGVSLPTFGGQAPESTDRDIGKASFDFSDPATSLIGGIGNIIGLAGELGIPGGPQIKDVVPPVADALTNSPVGAIGGGIVNILGAPGRFVEEQYAKARLGSDDPLVRAVPGAVQAGLAAVGRSVAGPVGGLAGTLVGQTDAIPADIAQRLAAGEDIDTLAAEMVKSGRGYSENTTKELGIAVLFDPLNLIGPGIGAGARIVTGAGRAVNAGADIGRFSTVVGKSYNMISGGLSAGRQASIARLVGPATSGVIHHVGVANYNGIRSGLRSLSPAFDAAFEGYASTGNAQLMRAFIGEQLGNIYRLAIGRITTTVQDIRGALPKITEEAIEGAAIASRGTGRLEKHIQELFARVAPDFSTIATDAELLAITAKRLATVTGASIEEAEAALGTINVGKAQAVHLAYYGRAIDELVEAKALSLRTGRKLNIDLDRLTLVAPNTLDRETAVLLRQAIKDGDDITDAIHQYDDLAGKFLGKNATDTDVDAYLAKLIDNDALPELVRKATTKKNALPSPIGDWRAKYEADGGYRLGFTPESGWKAIIDNETGDVLIGNPFIPIQSAREALTTRNPIGRFVDSLTRGVSQSIIISESRTRFIREIAKEGVPLSSNQARSVFTAVLQQAAHEGVAPRGLTAVRGSFKMIVNGKVETVTGRGANGIDEVFGRFLTPEEMTDLRAKAEPTVLVMRALEGNFRRVGVTQKITGRIKTVAHGFGVPIAQIAEYYYPKLKFELNPFFQLQEYIESPFFNELRGIREVNVTPAMTDVYKAVGDLEEFRFIAEAGHVTHLWNARVVDSVAGHRTTLGRALAGIVRKPVAESKEARRAAQVFFEHGTDFEKAVNDINPRFWQTYVDEYGTTDPHEIARRFFEERIALTAQDVEGALAGLGRAAGMSADEATVMGAWLEAFGKSSRQAFKTHFFAPERAWLERTLNHPFLGLYPLSYMWGKVLPEFARFLILRPFGLNAPLVGLAALNRTQQSIAAAMLEPEFADFVANHKDSIFALELLLPGSPTNLPVNAPGWARHLARGDYGRDITLQDVTDSIGDSTSFAISPVKSLDVLAGVAGDLIGDLTRAADQYDTWVPARNR